MEHYCGIDWGGLRHAVCVIDATGRVVMRVEVEHDAAGLADLHRRLGRVGAAAELPVALERPSGLLVDHLVAWGHPVVPIHPNAVKASRPRYRAAGGKHDAGDAYLLADLLRTDGHRFQRLLPPSDEIQALRALVRGRDDLVAARVALANQLRSLLESYWPGAASIFADVDSPIALAFIRRYPTPASAAQLGEKRLAAFLAKQAYCGRRTPGELLARLRKAPSGLAGRAEADAKGELAQALCATLESLVSQIALLTAQVQHAVAEIPHGRVIMSFPRTGKVNAAQILAEIGDRPGRFLTDQQLAAEAGVCPVTFQSGKSRGVAWRWACNKRLRTAITCFADNSRRASPWANAFYTAARQRGCDHPHAVRILARAWLRVLWRAWHDQQPYDPARHNAASRIAA